MVTNKDKLLNASLSKFANSLWVLKLFLDCHVVFNNYDCVLFLGIGNKFHKILFHNESLEFNFT